MGQSGVVAFSGGVLEVGRRVEKWRRTRRKLGPMPEELWEAAAELAAKEGPTRVSRALGLEYNSLKRRMRRCSVGGDGAGEAGKTLFVELGLSAGGPQVGCVVSMVRVDGAQMEIRLPGTSEVESLSRLFWSVGR